MEFLTEKDIRNELKTMAAAEGTQKILAKKLKIPESYLSEVINERRIPDQLAKKIGYKKVFVKKDLK